MSLTTSSTTAEGSGFAPVGEPGGMFAQYGSVVSRVPSAQSGEAIEPPAPALQLMPSPGISPVQLKLAVESGLPVGSNTDTLLAKSSTVLKSFDLRSTISV